MGKKKELVIETVKPQAQPEVKMSGQSGVFKLKDKQGRSFQQFDLMKQFGFIPNMIVIEKIHGENNTLRLHGAIIELTVKKKDTKLSVKTKDNGKSKRANNKSSASKSASSRRTKDDVPGSSKARYIGSANHQA